MVRPIIILLGAIPILAALFIVVPTLLRPEIPNVAVNSDDVISIEYSKQHLKKISFGLTQSIGADTTEVLTISNDGQTTYSLTKNGYSEPDTKYQLSKDEVKRITALIKETGFMEMPKTSYQVKSDLNEYEKFGLQVTLDGKSINVQWPDQNSTQEFIPPLINEVQNSLDGVIAEIIK
ncbi:MAG TPA: hypothetical protein VFA69_07700 [Candidatus Nitrosotalea sp.]|nr:hypothetical protein [Candidatus Nitrosotalea sp.]